VCVREREREREKERKKEREIRLNPRERLRNRKKSKNRNQPWKSVLRVLRIYRPLMSSRQVADLERDDLHTADEGRCIDFISAPHTRV
jgi:hypothetical protein